MKKFFITITILFISSFILFLLPLRDASLHYSTKDITPPDSALIEVTLGDYEHDSFPTSDSSNKELIDYFPMLEDTIDVSAPPKKPNSKGIDKSETKELVQPISKDQETHEWSDNAGTPIGTLGRNKVQMGQQELSTLNVVTLEFVDCYKGLVLVSAPDTLELFQKSKLVVRIAGPKAEEKGIRVGLPIGSKRTVSLDTIDITQIMGVTLKESSEEERVKINKLNSDSVQVIDGRTYTQWTFDITPISFGKTSLIVTISAYMQTSLGVRLLDKPVYEKEFEIFASNPQKFKQFWRKNYITILVLIVGLFLIIYKLIPNQKIIQYHMATSNNSNFWNAGALGLVIYILTIASIFVFKAMDVSLWYVPLVFVGVILLYTSFTAVTLRDNDKLSEKNFLTLMRMTLTKIPPLNLFFKNSEKDDTEKPENG